MKERKHCFRGANNSGIRKRKPYSKNRFSQQYVLAARYDQFAWKLPGLSVRSNVCAPKKSRCACTRFAGSRSER